MFHPFIRRLALTEFLKGIYTKTGVVEGKRHANIAFPLLAERHGEIDLSAPR